MIYRRVGRSGLQTSVVSLGAWATVGERLGVPETVRMLDEAYGLGVNFFDNAEAYLDGRAEEVMGHALAQLEWPRETYLLSSKVYWGTGCDRPTAARGGRGAFSARAGRLAGPTVAVGRWWVFPSSLGFSPLSVWLSPSAPVRKSRTPVVREYPPPPSDSAQADARP
jgi:hypothetical protein